MNNSYKIRYLHTVLFLDKYLLFSWNQQKSNRVKLKMISRTFLRTVLTSNIQVPIILDTRTCFFRKPAISFLVSGRFLVLPKEISVFSVVVRRKNARNVICKLKTKDAHISIVWRSIDFLIVLAMSRLKINRSEE